MGTRWAAELWANIKADLSRQRPSPASLVSPPTPRVLWDVSPSASRNVAVPSLLPPPPHTTPITISWLSGGNTEAAMKDASAQIQSPALQSECITRQGASARRFGFDNKSPCFHEFKSDFKTSPLMFF